MRSTTLVPGVVLVALGGFLLLERPADRLHVATIALSRSWPYLLLALAAVNLTRTIVPHGRWIAPTVLGVLGGTGLLLRSSLDLHTLGAHLLAPALLVAGAAVIGAGHARAHPGRWVAALVTRTATAEGSNGDHLLATAFLAELRLDLTQLTWQPATTLRASVVLGRLHLLLPQDLALDLVDGGFLVHLNESGTRRVAGAPTATITIQGALGRVDVIRS